MEITNSKIQITNKHQRPKIKFPNSCHRPIWLLVNLILGFVWDLGSGICIFCLLISAGCGDNPGYTNSSLYPENIGTVYRPRQGRLNNFRPAHQRQRIDPHYRAPNRQGAGKKRRIKGGRYLEKSANRRDSD
jgi:hypothetical protein